MTLTLNSDRPNVLHFVLIYLNACKKHCHARCCFALALIFVAKGNKEGLCMKLDKLIGIMLWIVVFNEIVVTKVA